MVANKKITGRATSLPAGLAIGAVCSLAATLVLTAILAKLVEAETLPVEKVAWNPYPKWIIRYFNFNDWVSLSIRRKNLYKVGASAGEK